MMTGVIAIVRDESSASGRNRVKNIMKLWLCLAGFGLLLSTGTAANAAEPAKKFRVLMVTQSKEFTHGPVKREKEELAPSEVAITQLGQQTGLFTVHCTQNAADLTKENLQNYDMVMFYTQAAAPLPIKDEDAQYFVGEWLKQKGHSFVGFHSATDTYRNTDPSGAWYREMIGGTFNGHPWNAGETVTVTVHDTKHPGTRGFEPEFQIKDEIYQYSNWYPERVRVLMSLNMAKCQTKKPYHVPVSWVKTWGDGRIYYTNLGHNTSTWTDKRFLTAIEGGIRWAAGLEEADATPNPEVSAAENEKAKATGAQ